MVFQRDHERISNGQPHTRIFQPTRQGAALDAITEHARHGETIAWGDESIRSKADPPMYLMAAVIQCAPSDDMGAIESLKPKGARKLHWRHMSRSLQLASARAVGKAGIPAVVVVASPMDGRRTERARRKCLEALLSGLEERGVDMLVLESRGAERDANDRRFLAGIRGAGLARRIRLEHRPGESDPRLWAADQVLGIIGDKLAGDVRDADLAWSLIRGNVEVISIAP